MRHRLTISIIVCAAFALIGAIMFLALYMPYRSYQAQYALLKANNRLADTYETLQDTSNILVYGTITSVDVSGGAFTMNTTGSTLLTIRLLEKHFLARQTLHMSSNGSYDSLSQVRLNSVADVHPGERVAVLLSNFYKDALSSDYVIVGDPL